MKLMVLLSDLIVTSDCSITKAQCMLTVSLQSCIRVSQVCNLQQELPVQGVFCQYKQPNNAAAGLWHLCTYIAWNMPMAETKSVVDVSAGRPFLHIGR